MKEIKLADFVSLHGQAETARQFGITPSAVRKAIDSKRDIRVRWVAGGKLEAVEIKPFPSPEFNRFIARREEIEISVAS